MTHRALRRGCPDGHSCICTSAPSPLGPVNARLSAAHPLGQCHAATPFHSLVTSPSKRRVEGGHQRSSICLNKAMGKENLRGLALLLFLGPRKSFPVTVMTNAGPTSRAPMHVASQTRRGHCLPRGPPARRWQAHSPPGKGG